ncbi:MAG: sulfurtransferase [Magnetococcales bacterium]|nr:sulfurtransferase [Magnetococcales bacterium]MBF0148593.1 sulfurtransferase [Magnetococcales bacterium]MBF0347322.1 sulfurtransferase [Magnetococcales bacterium]MBF0629714.1 sulfurtransferase [Magnetococcales bacterium]
MNASNGIQDQDPSSMCFVQPEWLASRLKNTDLRIVQLDGEKYYHQFHIPGAVQLSYGKLVTKRNEVPGVMADPADLAREFGRLGIGNETPVVAYDLTGGLDAARFLWTLATVGHTGFKAVLDGGLPDWHARNRPMESGAVQVLEAVFQWRLDGRWLVEHEEVLAVAEGRREAILVDTRSAKEYQGMTVRGPRGHIRGAVHFDWTDSLAGPRDLRLKALPEIKGQLAELGISDPGREIILYCETAHRAAHTWLLMLHLGYEKVRLYDGSIAEWRVLDLPTTMD